MLGIILSSSSLEFYISAATATTCGDNQAIDPTPINDPPYIKDIPVTVFVKVYKTGADATKSCLGYTLTVAH